MKNTNTMDKQDRHFKATAEHDHLKTVYDEIAKLHIRTPEDMKEFQRTARYDQLGGAIWAYAERIVRGKRGYAEAICGAGYLDRDDLAGEIAMKLLEKTLYIMTKEPEERPDCPPADPSEYRMGLAGKIAAHKLHDLWRAQTSHWGREIKGSEPEKRFTQGFHLESMEELLENGLDQASQASTPEEQVVFQDNVKQLFQVIQGQKLSQKQLAAFLGRAVERGLDQDIANAWAKGSGAAFANAKALVNARSLAKKKLESVKPQIYALFDRSVKEGMQKEAMQPV